MPPSTPAKPASKSITRGLPSAEPIRRTQVERRQEAERRIIEAAIEIVSERGLPGLTLASAGAAAGYSRSIASHHFGKKDNLLIAICRHITQSFNDSFDSPNAETGLSRIFTIVQRYFNGVRNNSARIRALYLILTEAVHQPGLSDALAQVNQHSVRRIQFHFQRAIVDGDIRADVNANTQAVLLLASLRGVMAQYLVNGADLNLSQLENEFVAMLKRNLTKEM